MQDEPPSRRNALIALLVMVALAAFGVWVSRTLQDAGRAEDCLMQGRRNCGPLDPARR